jgi:hypothetical protein
MHEGKTSPAPTSSDNCAARQSAHSLLQQHAENLRRQAGQLHQQADRVEDLARWASGMPGNAEEALWRMAVESISGLRRF